MSPIKLPASIQEILGDLVADQGRERAWTLLRILAAGPDWVEQNIAAIHLALGARSPGVPALERLVQLTRDAADPSSPKVAHQHFISQCLSGRFTELINPKASLQLLSYAIQWRKVYPKGTGGVGYVDDCVTRTQGGIDVEDRTRQAVLCQRWRKALRDRPAGGGPKPPQAAPVKSRSGERCGKRRTISPSGTS